MTPWRSDMNHTNVATQSPLNSIGAPLATSVRLLHQLVTFHCYA